jgi:pimeloyl-ACP methyl ester carboxylesterase
MTTFVLLHGGGMGGWAWKYAAAPLRAAGHDVFTPTFTGFGERVHLLSADVSHATHVRDVLNVLHYEDLSEVVLVGHSYAGSVIPGVVAGADGRVKHAVYCDAMVTRGGESVFETMGYLPPEQLPAVREAIAAGQMGPGTGVHEQERARLAENPLRMPAERLNWLTDHLSDMPIRPVTDPVAVGAEKMPPGTDYIAAKADPTMTASQARAGELGWRVHPWDSDHGFFIGEADRLAGFLLDRA